MTAAACVLAALEAKWNRVSVDKDNFTLVMIE